MDEQYPTYTSYDPVNSPIMDPERQLEAPEFGAAAAAPLAMLGLGLAGVAAFALTRRKKPTLQERVASLLEDSRDHVADFAKDTRDDVEPLAKSARKKGFKLFKRSSKAAGEALHEASNLAQDAAAAGAELLKQGGKVAGKAADQAYDQAKHFSKHEGRDLQKQVAHLQKDVQKASKEAAKAAKTGGSSVLDTYHKLEAKYPILTGLLVAALMSEGQKLFESYRTRNA